MKCFLQQPENMLLLHIYGEDTEDHILPHAINGTQEDVGDQGFAISTCQLNTISLPWGELPIQPPSVYL